MSAWALPATACAWFSVLEVVFSPGYYRSRGGSIREPWWCSLALRPRHSSQVRSAARVWVFTGSSGMGLALGLGLIPMMAFRRFRRS